MTGWYVLIVSIQELISIDEAINSVRNHELYTTVFLSMGSEMDHLSETDGRDGDRYK